MIQSIPVHVEGLAPLLLHNGYLANPRNPIVKEMKQVTSKRKKTDADLEEIARLEHLGGLYLDEKEQVVIPGRVITATLVNGAKKQRLGQQMKAGMWCNGNWPLIYDGPRTPAGLFADKRFVDEQLVRVSSAKVLRTRPVFPVWELKFEVQFYDEVLDERQIWQAIEAAGLYCGFGDNTPQNGRFIRKEASTMRKAS